MNVLRNIFRNRLRDCRFSSKKSFILGIETSCDDTGVAIVDESGKICGEALKSQQSLSTRFGGVIPIIAAAQHLRNLPLACEEALEASSISIKDIRAVAVTNEPGMVVSLKEGVKFAINLCKSNKIPLIPVHHMRAHALTARYTNAVEFPYACLLISGGHAIIAWVESAEEFVVLGRNTDNAPGEVLDKVARRLKLVNLNSNYGSLSGGRLLETVAKLGGDPFAVQLPDPLKSVLDCNFSFAGIATDCYKRIEDFEREYGVIGGSVLPNYGDVAASVQHAVFRHLAQKLMRAFEYVRLKRWALAGDRAGYPKTLVASGGVASNEYIRNGLRYVAGHYGCSTVFPPSKYCTDNGAMIAWNGLDKWKMQSADIIRDIPDDLVANAKSPLGRDANLDVIAKRLKRRFYPIWHSVDLSKNFYSHHEPVVLEEEAPESVVTAKC